MTKRVWVHLPEQEVEELDTKSRRLGYVNRSDYLRDLIRDRAELGHDPLRIVNAKLDTLLDIDR